MSFDIVFKMLIKNKSNKKIPFDINYICVLIYNLKRNHYELYYLKFYLT